MCAQCAWQSDCGPETANYIHFFISYAVAFLVLGLIGRWYIWPNIKDRAIKSALTPALRVPARQRFDVPNAGNCVAGATERFCGTDCLW
jgi:hypothetical protein